MGRFDGKRVFITGAGSGFGRRTSERFAEEGASTVYMVDRLQDWQKVCERTGGTFEQNQCSGANIKRGCVKSAAICALLGRTWSNETCA